MSDMYVSILEYNTHLFMGTAASSQSKHDKERREHMARKIHDFEIVGLCEVWSNDSKKFLAKESNSWCYDDNNNPSQMGSGLLLLSKHPILWHTFTKYKDLRGWDKLAQKGFLIAEISIPVTYEKSQNLLVVLTHAQSGTDIKDKECRKSNFAQLIQGISEAQKKSNVPAILLGDLNVEWGTDEWNDFAKSLPTDYVDAYAYLHPGRVNYHIDYILILGSRKIVFPYQCQSDVWKVRVKEKGEYIDIDCSDHNPWWASLRIVY